MDIQRSHELVRRYGAPFPYFGGKRHVADEIWSRFGDVGRYLEPFAGSMAVLLHRPWPYRGLEVVGDLDGHICNFYRAVRADPETAAHHAEYPTIHQDLTARHRWLNAWGAENASRLTEDPDWYDARAAGWWAWGKSNWIGGGWCDGGKASGKSIPVISSSTGGGGVSAQRAALAGSGEAARDSMPAVSPILRSGCGVSLQRSIMETGGGADAPKVGDKRPHVCTVTEGGCGVQAQRKALSHGGGGADAPKVGDTRPSVCIRTEGGRGVQAQRKVLSHGGGGADAPKIWDTRPHVCTGLDGGQGVQAQRKGLPHGGGGANGKVTILEWFEALQARLRQVIVLNRPWESLCQSNTIMAQVETSRGRGMITGVLLDPPYLTHDRNAHLYGSDLAGTSDASALESWEWAKENGERNCLRIAYCCHDGDFELPPGWTKITAGLAGIRVADRRHRRDCVMFSPHCLPEHGGETQGSLF